MARSKEKEAGSPASLRERLEMAAEKIILSEGRQSASIRRIAAEAGTNTSLISYHFGGLEQLILAVMQRNVDLFYAEEKRLTEALLSSGDAYDIRDLMRVFVGPLWVPACYNPEYRAASVVSEIYRGASPEIRSLAELDLQRHVGSFMSRLQQKLPQLPETEILWRLSAISGLVMNMMPGTPAWDGFAAALPDLAKRKMGSEPMLDIACAVITA